MLIQNIKTKEISNTTDLNFLKEDLKSMPKELLHKISKFTLKEDCIITEKYIYLLYKAELKEIKIFVKDILNIE